MIKYIFFWAAILCNFSVIAQNKAELVLQQANMYQVDDKLYRSEQLTLEDKNAFREANIKTIINLRYFSRNENEEIFDDTEGITLINNPLLTWRVKPKDIAKVLKSIRLHQKNGAVLVHCYHGADRTGIMIAMYRIIYHGWTIEQAKNEMQQGPYGYHSLWKNLDKLLSEKNVRKVRAELQRI